MNPQRNPEDPAPRARETRAAAPADHWSELAQTWRQVGPPLRVAADDVRAYESAVAVALRNRPRPRALLLGVTPELFGLPWPDGTDLRAVDRSRAMIERVWPGPRADADCADWRRMPLPDGSRDLALCDGGLHLLSYPAEQEALVRSLARVLARDGRCVFRLFTPPRERESGDEVLADLRRGRIRDVNVLKLRLGMALQARPEEGVGLGAIWDAYAAHADGSDATPWPPEHTQSLAAYRGSTARYHFVTLEQATALFRDAGGFERATVVTPAYELGERCPIVEFRRGGRDG